MAVYYFLVGLIVAPLLAAATAFPATAQAGLPSPDARAAADPHPLRKQLTEIVRNVSAIKAVPQALISPDGSQIAYTVADGERSTEQLFVASLAGPPGSRQVRPALMRGDSTGSQIECRTGEPAWSPNSKELAFLSNCMSSDADKRQMQLFVLDTAQPGALPQQRSMLTGHLGSPKWSPDGAEIALLFVDHATRAPTPMAAGDSLTGVIDDLQQQEAQRLILIAPATGKMRMFSPSGLNIFEYDWSPDSRTLAYTAAPPPGDDNWYIAQLYTQGLQEAEGRSIFKPEFQIAVPRWSPDGKQIAYIAGLMSDEGATGGEIYVLPSNGGQPRNLTPGRLSSPAWLRWLSPERLLFTEFKGGSNAINTLDVRDGRTATLWEAGETIHAAAEESSVSVASAAGSAALGQATQSTQLTSAMVRQSWTTAPEVWAGPLGKWVQVTHVNEGTKAGAGRVESVTWQSDGFHVQGWLLFPRHYDASKRYPMLVSVHGGPAWIQTPSVTGVDFEANSFMDLGYFIFLPNPRGSFGEGEKFTEANKRDWGFGDLRDTLAGVDAVAGQYPVDTARIGMLGWSYGGSTAMMAVGRTNRFRAVVAGAGASNLQSYYGQNQIDKWMLPYFGASVYDDPAAYMRSSALSYVKQVKTPTLLLVGERDEEAPPPQSFEFWHALKELGIPTQLVVYPGEGHSFHSYDDRVNLLERAAEWFAKYMPVSPAASAGK